MIEMDVSAIHKLEAELAQFPKKIPNVLVDSINRALVSGRAKAATKAKSIYSVKARTLKAGVAIQRANRSRLYATARFRGSVLPLAEFKIHAPRKRSRSKKRKFLRVVVKERKEHLMRHAFVIDSRGKRLVGERPRNDMKNIHWLYGPSVPQMMGEQRVIDEFERQAGEMFVRRVEHGIQYALEGGFGRR